MAAAAAAAASEVNTPKWEGKATATLHTPTADQVWPLLADFFSIHKLLPALDTCHKVDAADGLVRYCAAGEGDGLRWCHEKLVEIDHVDKWLTYEIVDNNMGFKTYKAKMKVVPVIDGGDGAGGCAIEWSFVTDPVEGLGYEDFMGYFELSVKGMAKNIEKELGLSG